MRERDKKYMLWQTVFTCQEEKSVRSRGQGVMVWKQGAG